MDRNTVIGFVLIFFLMLGWMYTSMPSPEELEQQRQERLARELAREEDPEPEQDILRQDVVSEDTTEDASAQALGVFGHRPVSDTLLTQVETPLFRVIFSNVGGGPASFQLKKHDRWEGGPVQMMSDTTRSAYSLEFLSIENYNIETDQLFFRPVAHQENMIVDAGEHATLQYELVLEDGSRILYTYTIDGDTYQILLNVAFDGTEHHISGRSFELAWKPAIPPTERDIASEAQYTAAYSYAGGVLERFQPSDSGYSESIITGNVNWVASKSKFFTQIIKAQEATDGAILSAYLSTDPSNGETVHDYSTAIRSRLSSDVTDFNYQLYIGPLDYYHLRDFDPKTYDMVDTGFGFMRWFSDPFVKYIILPFFAFVGSLTGNMGVTIILFAILIKIVLYPLTKKSFESMAAMRELQPEMEAIKEKYKDDPQKQQQATMKLFKTAKVNPLGSCLPNLLQIPVLITFWRFFQNAIEVRQEQFLWATDLAAPDIIIDLPFTIPLMGSHIAGFVLLMTATMVIQLKVSGQGNTASNPAMKMMQYVLPVMLLVIFNRLSSGLSLYYLVYNALSIAQQLMINKKMDHVKLMETVDKKKAKEMRREKLLEEKKAKKKNNPQ
ncbi:membrane protein insertase YidC [Balneolaceae bacterium ANBcel3]|nr:membrane protein insertase YidC [Balneolaceae bacterium ANBcel3]